MKTYLVSYETRDGEREYSDYFLLEARDSNEASNKARHALKHEVVGYGKWEDGILDCFETAHKIRSIEELPDPQEIKILSKRFWVVRA